MFLRYSCVIKTFRIMEYRPMTLAISKADGVLPSFLGMKHSKALAHSFISMTFSLMLSMPSSIAVDPQGGFLRASFEKVSLLNNPVFVVSTRDLSNISVKTWP